MNFSKNQDGLVPVIIQDSQSRTVLMLGYMNEEAYKKTKKDLRVTFFSRSKNRLWTKGEESGNVLIVKEVLKDCDNDTLLIRVDPVGPVCHTGADTCFNEKNEGSFIDRLEQVIAERKRNPAEGSYTSSLFLKGINKIAQKVGEEATELVIEAKDHNDELFLNEAADLLFHYLVLLHAKGKKMEDVIRILKQRRK